MITYKMPTGATLEMLSECSDIMADYRAAGFPRFPDSEPYVERMMAAGVICEEAVEILSTMVRKEV
jgi:hypothetical protein